MFLFVKSYGYTISNEPKLYKWMDNQLQLMNTSEIAGRMSSETNAPIVIDN